MSSLNAAQATFAQRLAQDVGLDAAVVQAWVLSEEPASAASAPNGANNWLNIGAFDAGGWAGGGANVWGDPTTAADATAAFILGHPVNGVSAPLSAAPGIRAIAGTAGQSPSAQVQAIQHSGWASSGYPNLPSVLSGVQGSGVQAPAPTAPSAAAAGSGGLGSIQSGLGSIAGVPIAGVFVVLGGVLLGVVALWAGGVTA